MKANTGPITPYHTRHSGYRSLWNTSNHECELTPPNICHHIKIYLESCLSLLPINLIMDTKATKGLENNRYNLKRQLQTNARKSSQILICAGISRSAITATFPLADWVHALIVLLAKDTIEGFLSNIKIHITKDKATDNSSTVPPVSVKSRYFDSRSQ